MRDPAEPLDPAEQRLIAHLAVMRTGQPDADEAFYAGIVKTARWQRAVRTPLTAVGALAGALVEGLDLLIGRRST